MLTLKWNKNGSLIVLFRNYWIQNMSKLIYSLKIKEMTRDTTRTAFFCPRLSLDLCLIPFYSTSLLPWRLLTSIFSLKPYQSMLIYLLTWKQTCGIEEERSYSWGCVALGSNRDIPCFHSSDINLCLKF